MDHLPVDVARSWRGEESHEHREVFRFAEVAGGAVLLYPGTLRFRRRQEPLVDLFGMDATRGDAIHGDAVPGHHSGERLGPDVDRAVWRRGGIERDGLVAPRDVDDASELAALHSGDKGVGEIPPGVEIQAHGLVPLLRRAETGQWPGCTGVVDENVEAAE